MIILQIEACDDDHTKINMIIEPWCEATVILGNN